MEVRQATRDDVDEIRRIARASLGESYGHALGEEILDEAVERWYDAQSLAEDLTEEDTVFVVAVDDGEMIGFAQSHVVRRREPVGEIDWLHVSPDHRGRGVGTQLLERVEVMLLDHGVTRIEGRVLVENETGTKFYEHEGFERADDRTVRIGDESFVERVYSSVPTGTEADAEEVVMDERTTPDDRTVYVAFDESVRATGGPFYAVYSDRDRSDRYGWFCGNDESFDLAMDTLERIVCNTCGNKSKPTRWDAAYL